MEIVHMSSFLLPLCAYNAYIEQLQVPRVPPLHSARHQATDTLPQSSLIAYTARLHNMVTPLHTFTGWTRPNSKEFLIHLNTKVQAVAVCRTALHALFWCHMMATTSRDRVTWHSTSQSA